MDFLADYVLRLSTKFIPEMEGVSVKNTKFRRKELLLVCDNIPHTTPKEAANNLSRLILSGCFTCVEGPKKRYVFALVRIFRFFLSSACY